MTNSKREYNEFIRANLPYGITYDSARYQYVTFNGKRFVTYLEAKWYIDYLTKFGGGPEDDIRNDLFGASEEGVWFEANDSTTLFTDVAGTTPVTTPGDAVALQLDKSQGLVRKRDLIPNTGNPFVNTDDWAITLAGTTASIVGGRFRVESGGTGGRVTTSITGLVVGETVFVTMSDLTVVGSPRVRVTTNSDGITGTIFTETPGTGDNSYSFIATQETMYLSVLNVTANTGVTEFGGATVEAIPGNHRTQATTAARPLYALHPVGGVRNLLEYTEEFDNAVWTKVNTTVTDNGDGSFDLTFADGTIGIISQTPTNDTADVCAAWDVKKVDVDDFDLNALTGGTVTSRIRYTFSTDSFSLIGTDYIDYGSIDLGDGWVRVWVVVDGDSASGTDYNCTIGSSGPCSGDETIRVRFPQYEKASFPTNYQRVGSFLDVSEEGKARRGRIWYNGTSHFMETGTITPGTDKVQVFAGLRKLSDAAVGTLMESSSNSSENDGSCAVFAPVSVAPNYRFLSRGSVASSCLGTGYSSPITSILTGLGDISGDSAILRIDGVQEDISTDDQGTGNYLAYPLYFGARNGTSRFYNGYEDTSIIRFGPNLDADTISKVESYVASKTPEETI